LGLFGPQYNKKKIEFLISLLIFLADPLKNQKCSPIYGFYNPSEILSFIFKVKKTSHGHFNHDSTAASCFFQNFYRFGLYNSNKTSNLDLFYYLNSIFKCFKPLLCQNSWKNVKNYFDTRGSKHVKWMFGS